MKKIEKLYILTYKREGNQVTFDSLPEKWKKKAVLVVHKDEKHEGYPTLICPVQGKGAHFVRKWISEYAKGTRYGVLDDDFYFCYTPKIKITSHNEKMTDELFDEMIDQINKLMDEGYVNIGADCTWNIPVLDKDIFTNSRITCNVFYDGERLPVDELDWLSVPFSEDYFVSLQLLKMGFKNAVLKRFRIILEPVKAKGGYNEMRTLDDHNNSIINLKKYFPNEIKIVEKIPKSGIYKGMKKLHCVIQWKKVFNKL